MPSLLDEGRIAALIDKILVRAIRENASDIHFEPLRDKIRIRFRVDGILMERSSIPGAFRAQATSRLKVLSRLDIAEKRLPQDGSFGQRIERVDRNFRISTFPTPFGEKIVLRVVGTFQGLQNISSLGMPPAMNEQLGKIINLPNGIILVTGPTGSGKTSTLYTLMRHRESSQVNIMTLEDPIEHPFVTITQGQVNDRVGFSFAVGLRAILRQDPDIIMVGEMRDFETSEIAFRAGLTGHLVLSSLHTNSAVETFVRLIDMGIPRYVVASALRAVIAQRLVRRLCQLCREQARVKGMAQSFLGQEFQTIFRAKGCHHCNFTGFTGRIGIFELVEMDVGLADLIKDSNTTLNDYKLAMAARKIPTLRRAGLELISQGVTTWEELLRVA